MSHSYLTEHYNLVDRKPRKDRTGGGLNYIWPQGQWAIFHNDASGPNEPVTIVLREIDGEELNWDDPRRIEIKIPFGLMAEFVGFRVARDRLYRAELDESRGRHILGLSNQGPEPEAMVN